MKLYVKGDPHNKISAYYKELEGKTGISLCVGDFGTYPDLTLIEKVDRKAQEKSEVPLEKFNPSIIPPIHIYSVPGNHEDQEYLDDLYDENGIINFNKNLTFLHCAVVELEPNLYLIGLGKIFAESTLNNYSQEHLNKFGCRDRKLNLGMIKRRNHITKDELKKFIDRLLEFNRTRDWVKDKVIWISHDAPIHTDMKRNIKMGVRYIGELLDLAAPDLAVFGHYHHELSFDKDIMIINKNELKEMII